MTEPTSERMTKTDQCVSSIFTVSLLITYKDEDFISQLAYIHICALYVRLF